MPSPLTRIAAVPKPAGDGVLPARFPHLDAAPAGSGHALAWAFRHTAAALDRGVAVHPGPIGGVTGLIAPRRVPDIPMAPAAVTKAEGAIAAIGHPLAFWVIAGTALAALVLAAILVRSVRRPRGREQLAAVHAATVRAEAARAVAEAALERARERDAAARVEAMRFQTALGNMLQGLVMYDGAGCVLVVNPRFNALLGLPPDAVRPGMDHDAFVQAVIEQGNVPGRDIAALLAMRRPVVEQKQRHVLIWELSDGRAFSVTYLPMEEGWLTTYEDISDRRRVDQRLARLAHTDPLTDLPNRVRFHERLEHALAFALRGRLVALLCLDLDQFKTVNDRLGHPVGDALLQAVSRRLSDQLRGVDMMARLGGDEFGIIQTTIKKPSDAAGLAARLIDVLDAPFAVGEHQLVINTSIGIALAPQDGADADALLKNAELALYRAKTGGRRTFRLFQAQMDTEFQARCTMEIELRAALQGGAFELFYQPLIGVATRSVSGFEALLRWRHPARGLVLPGVFIGLAEETGLIVPIGAWVLHAACAAAAAWPEHIRLAVNLSPVQFTHPGIVQAVVAALRDAGLAPGRLELEITESAMMADTPATVAILHEFRALGVHIAMDDFGTGYSSLAYLRRFPFDRIKIDQSFVRELGRQKDCGAIVRAVTGLSRELDIAITAEGVETTEQMRELVMAGCTDLQGVLFSPPVAGQEIAGLLRTLEEMDELMPPVGLVA